MSGRKISLDNFRKLKPFWVRKFPKYARDTCLCKDHENFKLMMKKLYECKVLKTFKVEEFMSSICCQIENRECVYRECSRCKNFQFDCEDNDKMISYDNWITRTIERKGSKGRLYIVKLTEKKKVESTLGKLVGDFSDFIPKFFIHQFRTWHQFQTLEKIRKNLKPNKVYFLSDLSQNLEGKYCRQIHAAHFGASKKQISLLTGGFYYLNESGDVCFTPFASASDCLNHESHGVWALMNPVFKKIKEVVPDVHKIFFQSDGPTSQVKNKTNFFLFRDFCEKMKIKSAAWNYTTAGHGKSAADAIGGCIKNIFNREVLLGKNILTAQDVVDVITQKSKILAYCVDKVDFDEIEKLVPSKLTVVPRTMEVHQVVWHENKPDELNFRYMTCIECGPEVDCQHYHLPESTTKYVKIKPQTEAPVSKVSTRSTKTYNSEFKVGDWVCVLFDMWYPGEILKITKTNTLMVKFMARNNKFFHWPQRKDIQEIYEINILCAVDQPKKQATGKFFYFDENKFDEIELLANNYVVYEADN